MIVTQIDSEEHVISESDDAALEARMREKLFAKTKPKLGDAREAKMIAKVFGSTVVADDFLRRENSKPLPGRTARKFKAIKPTVKFVHWEHSAGWWAIEKYENGNWVGRRTGTDYAERDSILRKIGVSGAELRPMTVSEIVPRPVVGRVRDSAKPKSQRMAILEQIGQLDSDDVADFDLEDWIWEGEDD